MIIYNKVQFNSILIRILKKKEILKDKLKKLKMETQIVQIKIRKM